MRNQPKYNFFKNTFYAINGLMDLIKNETSFKIELFAVAAGILAIFLVDVSFMGKMLLFLTLVNILFAEAINSAIERVVDLVTLDYHQLAGRAKDIGSSVVFISIAICLITWALILGEYFFK